jgi:dTDP-4-dehydrorhamnose 3,5-epimerase-like enzyme
MVFVQHNHSCSVNDVLRGVHLSGMPSLSANDASGKTLAEAEHFA